VVLGTQVGKIGFEIIENGVDEVEGKKTIAS